MAFTVEDLISAEDSRRNQRVKITQNGSGYILSYDHLGTGEHFEKWFDNLCAAQGIFFMFCFDFIAQRYTDDIRQEWVK